MTQIEKNSPVMAQIQSALDKIYKNLGYKILFTSDMKDDPEYCENTLVQIRVLDGRDYMLDVWLLKYPDKDEYYVESSIGVEFHNMGQDEQKRWLDSVV